MRVHLLVTDLEIGGTPRVVKELAIRLRPRGFETRVACLSPWGPVADELTAAGVPVTAFGATSVVRLPGVVRQARRWADGADVLWSFLVHANVVAALARRGRTRLIGSMQGTQERPRWHWWLQAWANRRADCVVVPSASVAAKNARLLRPRCCRVIPNAVDRPATLPTRERPPGPFRVAFVGRLDPVKRVPDLVAAVARVAGVKLHVYGDGEDRPHVLAAVARHDVGDRVTLHGRVASAAVAWQTADVLVLPSEAEGFGLVLIEAMAAGVPVVATRVPGIVDVVEDGRTGLLVPPGDPAELSAVIGRVKEDVSLREGLIRVAFDEVGSRFSWESVLDRYEDLLRGDRG